MKDVNRGRIQVRSFATCKRCGSKKVAWVTSRKTGKYYLVEAFETRNGEILADRKVFHSRFCGTGQNPWLPEGSQPDPAYGMVQAQEEAYWDRLNESTGAGE